MSEKTTDNKCPNCGRITNTILTIMGKNYCPDCSEQSIVKFIEALTKKSRRLPMNLKYTPTLAEMNERIDKAEKVFDMTTPTTLFQGARFTPELFRRAIAEVSALADRCEEEEKKTNDQLYESCAWTEDEDGDWDTACDNKHCFAIDGPTENEYKYCPYCGKPIQVFKYEAEAHNE